MTSSGLDKLRVKEEHKAHVRKVKIAHYG